MTDQPQYPVPRFRRDESISQLEQMRAQALPAARPDLQISPQLYLGKTVYVVKDPVSLQYYRLQPAEHYVLTHLDGERSANELAHECSRRFADLPTEPDDVLNFVHMLHTTGLLLGEGAHAAQLRVMRAKRKKKQRFATLTNFLFIKLPVLDPDRLLDAMHGVLAYVMNRVTCTLAIIYMLFAAGAAILNLDKVQHVSMPILSWQNLLIMSAVFFSVKIIHEFGHGLAAKHRGLEVHEMGILFMVFIPMFYVDTTDAWMVPRRRDRLWITAGGVFIEFLFAATAVWVWLSTEPGVVNLIALDIMIAASVTTVLFNANPLLRYDGYYFLMDWLEIPNLKSKANQFLAYLAKRYLLAMDEEEPPAEAATKPIFMPIYAVASALYRLLITFGIITLVWHILDPYGLEVIGSVLGLFAIATMILVPLFKFFKFIWTQQCRNTRRTALTALGTLALAGLCWAVASIPLQQDVERPMVVMAQQRAPVYVPVNGRVAELFITADTILEPGQPILRIEADELTEQLDTHQVERQMAQLELNIARQKGRQELITSLVKRLQLLNEQIDYTRQKISQLTVRAPVGGRLYVNGNMAGLLGSYLKRGQELGTIVGQGPREMFVVIPQTDAALVHPDMTARVRLWSMPQITFEGHVERLGGQFIRSMPHEALSSVYTGEVDTRRVDQYKSMPATPSVVARIALDHAPDVTLFDGMTGRCKIITGRTTFGSDQWRRIRQAMSLDWWL
ncbi:HlyD family efflux transporter periplasmic adaptor subunit [Planctomycetales bacterium ZRK34]|nr:HlyD family efflux transporter periplasmic adaptor subunit [Planctomycetales bacterium ZRK34]